MSIKNLIDSIKNEGLLRSMKKLDELYELAINNEQKVAGLQAERDQLAAECAALKEYISEKCYIVDPKADITANADIPAEDFQPQTPATDRFLAEQRAVGVEMFADHLRTNDKGASVCKMIALGADDFAAQLRNEVKV